jgi:hypothetical protein
MLLCVGRDAPSPWAQGERAGGLVSSPARPLLQVLRQPLPFLPRRDEAGGVLPSYLWSLVPDPLRFANPRLAYTAPGPNNLDTVPASASSFSAQVSWSRGLTRSPDPSALPILRLPSWPIGEDAATRLALPHLGWEGVVPSGCAPPNRNVGAPTAGTPWAVVIHGLTTGYIVA